MNKSLEQDNLYNLASKLTFKRAWDSILDDINNDVLLSGKPLDTLVLLGKLRTYIMVSGILLFPLSIFLTVEFSPIFLGLNMIWILIFTFPKIHQSNLSNERKKRVDEEISSFVILASVMQGVGVGLYDSFQLFRETGLFDSISKEARLLKRNVEYFGLSQMESLEELGRTHKSEFFKNLLLGYTTIWRSGGDLSLYLEGRAEEFFTHLKDRYQVYTTNVGTIVEVLVTMLIILPIMIMVGAFILPGSSLGQITLLSTIALPIFTIVLSVIIISIQPSSFNVIGLNSRILSVLAGTGFAIGIAIFALTNEVWMSLMSGIMIPSIISAVIVGRHNREIDKLEQSLPQFLRDITEYKKIGYDVVLAIENLSKENLYNKFFNKKLGELSILLTNGTAPVTSVKNIEYRSWFAKMSFYLLAYIAEYGGGTAQTLETISRFITTAKHTVKQGKSEISALTMIIFAAPLIMAFTAGMLLNIISSIDSQFVTSSTITADTLQGTHGFDSGFLNAITITPEFLSMIKTLIVTSSLLGAFVITKAIDFTFHNTWRVVTIGFIAMASVLLVDSELLTLDIGSIMENLMS